MIKRLYTFVLQRFLPVFAMTFFITLFIVMMQFLWRYIDDLVGKGLGVDVIAELFYYASLTMVPTALPLAVLLAALMTFGNLGEHFELTAMKAAGVSLFRIMRPLIILMVFIAGGAFFFQNNVLPYAQTKMWTLMFSIRQKTPEMEIPEGVFYNDLPGMNLYVAHKDRATGRLDSLTIYDTSRGMDKMRVILADSGRISVTHDKSRLCVDLYKGELYEDFKDNVMGGTVSPRNMPFRRETFDRKTAYIAFDANFNRMDDSTMRAQYIGKNISELRTAIDSIQIKVDSIGTAVGKDIKEFPYVGVPYYTTRFVDHEPVKVRRPAVLARALNLDSLFTSPTPEAAKGYVRSAILKAERFKNEYEFKAMMLDEQQTSLRRHEIEMHKKFTLSIACIIFFFIGAPLGAIIKKGGLGMPLVISVLLFVVYFIFDNMGYKMARDGRMEVVAGMWLSTMVMFPLGVFFTYKAVGDTTMLDLDPYRRAWNRLRRWTGKTVHDHKYEKKVFTMVDVDPGQALSLIEQARDAVLLYRHRRGRRIGPGMLKARKSGKAMVAALEAVTEYLSNTRHEKVIDMLNHLPSYRGVRASRLALATLDQLHAYYTDLNIEKEQYGQDPMSQS